MLTEEAGLLLGLDFCFCLEAGTEADYYYCFSGCFQKTGNFYFLCFCLCWTWNFRQFLQHCPSDCHSDSEIMKTTESGPWSLLHLRHQQTESFQTGPGTRWGPAQTWPDSERPELQHSGRTRHIHHWRRKCWSWGQHLSGERASQRREESHQHCPRNSPKIVVLNVSSKVSPSPDLVQVGAGARGEGLGVRVEVREGVGGESAGLLRSAPDRAQTH